jgi:GTP cyclohydrolase I
MKQQETMLNTLTKDNALNGFSEEEIGDDHIYTGLETPMKSNAFVMSDNEKKEKISDLFAQIMDVMGLDLTDDSLKGTPNRVAKMYIEEIFSGLNPDNKPKIALFENKYQYNQMLVEKNITFYSNCEHHFVPIIGQAHIAYVSSGKVIGLSKINTNQIAMDLKSILDTDDIAVIIDAKHLCVSSRGVKDDASATVTSYYGGVFDKPHKIAELQNYLN